MPCYHLRNSGSVECRGVASLLATIFLISIVLTADIIIYSLASSFDPNLKSLRENIHSDGLKS